MFNAGGRDRKKGAGSLLSLGSSTRDGYGEQLPELPPEPAEEAVMRHRLARSRRETVPSPLLAALAEVDKRETEPNATGQHASADRGPDGAEPHAAAGLGARIRERLVGRSAPTDRRSGPGMTAQAPADAWPEDAGKPLPAEPARSADPRLRDERMSGSDGGHDDIWRPLIDPMKVIMGVVNSKALIASTTVLGALLGIAIALSTPKKYEAAAEILIDPRDLKLVDRDLTQPGLPSDATLAIVENQVRVLTSGTVLNKVVDKLNLVEDPEFNGAGTGGLGRVISDLRSLLSRRDASDGGDRRRALAVEHLAESLSVERGGKTFVIVVAAKTQDPEKSALIANTMTDVFLQTYGELQSGTAGRAAGELTARLDELRSGVEAAERKVEAFKAENDLIDAQGRLISDDEIVKLNEQLSVARARTLELNARAASSRDVDVHDALGGGLPEELNSNVMTELRSQYAALKMEADRLSARLGPRHPERLAAEAQLDGARGRIANELRRIVTSIQTELKRAVQLEQELSTRLAQLKVRQGTVSDDLVTLRELEREASAKRAVYESFLLRARETGEQKDINTANMSVISRAFAPLVPVGPSRSMVVLTGAVLGFMAGVGLGGARGAWQSLSENAGRPQRGRRQPPAVSASRDGLPPEPPEPRDPARRPPPQATHYAEDRRDVEQPPRPGEDGVSRGWLEALRRIRAGQSSSGSLQAAEPMPDDQPQQPGLAHPAMPQQIVHPQQFVAVQAQVPMPAYPAMEQVWAPYGFVQPPGYPAAYPSQFMPSVRVMPQPYPVYPPQPLYQQAPLTWMPPAKMQHRAANDQRQAAAPNTIEEIRDSLRDFREAVRELAESRSRRRAG